jgi:hypothetical protein
MTSKLDKELVRKIWTLSEKQPWLKSKVEEVLALVDECDSVLEQDLLLGLLERFHYIGRESYKAGLKAIANYLFDSLAIHANEAQFYAMQIGSDPDSSSEVMYRLETLISGDYDVTIFSKQTMSRIPLCSLAERPHIVIVDEFIGSGQTFRARMQHLKDRAKSVGIVFDWHNVHFCYLAGMKHALAEMRAEFDVDIFCAYELDKGIEGYFSSGEVASAYETMARLESTLVNPCPDSKDTLPALGYNGAEALYHRDQGNTPNSVFPVFWWKYRVDLEQPLRRNTLLRRRV